MAPNDRYFNGKKYRSAFEARVARDLHERSVPYKYEEDHYPFEISTMYIADFTLPLGVVVECKGYMDAHDRRLLVAIKAKYPNEDIRLLFQRAKNKINSKSKRGLTYGQWATKHGFMWAEGTIPESWVLARE